MVSHYNALTVIIIPFDLYNCMKMVGHDNVFVQNDVRVMRRQTVSYRCCLDLQSRLYEY